MLNYLERNESFDNIAEACFTVDEQSIHSRWGGIEAPDKKMLVKQPYNEYLSVVNKTYSVIQNKDILDPLHEQMLETFGEDMFDGSEEACKISVDLARNGATTFVEYKFPKIKQRIETTNGFTNDLIFRAIMKNTFDGSSAATLYIGNIDMFCTNGMILGDFDIMRKTHRGQFEIKNFTNEFRTILDNYQSATEVYSNMARTRIGDSNIVRNLFDKLVHKDKVNDPEWVANRKEDHASDLSNKLYAQYEVESQQRGNNIYSIMSAMTNFSSHGDGGYFPLNRRQHGNDNDPVRMFNRENKVSKWLASNTWKDFCSSYGVAA
jgi:hypothetical protein